MNQIKKTLSALLALCLITTVFPFNQDIPAFAAGHEIEPINLTIDWQRSDSVNLPLAFGINTPSDLDQWQMNRGDYNNIIKYANPGVVRYTAPGLEKWFNSRKKEWNTETIESFLDMLNPASEIVICMPIWNKKSWLDKDDDGILDSDKVDDYAELCGQLVKIVNRDRDRKIQYWEIPSGPEELYFTGSQKSNPYERAENLAYLFHRVSSEMKTADSSIDIGISIPSKPEFYDGIKHFLHEIVDRGTYDLSFIGLRSYADINKNDDNTDLYDQVYNPKSPNLDSIIERIKDIQGIIKEEAPSYKIQILLSEYGIDSPYSDKYPQFETHIQAVFDALVMIYAYNNGVRAVPTWNDMDNSTHVLQLYNNYLLGKQVQSSSQDERKIVSFAAIDKSGKSRSYLVINRSDNVQLIDTRFKQYTPHGRAIQQHQVSKDGYTIKSSCWDRVINNIIAIPAHSITLWTDIQTAPSILPPVIPVIQPHPNYRMPYLSSPILSRNREDTIPPSEPDDLSLLSVTSTTAALKWDKATDNRTIKRYNIYYGDTYITSIDPSSTTCFIQGLLPNTSYNGFYVRTEDWAGNQSKASTVLYFTTSRDTHPPTAPINPQITPVGSTSVRLSWESSFDDVKVARYEIFLNNAQIAATDQTIYQYNGLKSENDYNFSIRARDAAGNCSNRVDFDKSESPPSSGPSIDNELTFLRKLIEKFISSEGLKHPLSKQLYNFLNQAEHHMNNKKAGQALHHFQKMIEHLNKKSTEKFITRTIKEKLLDAINELVDEWED